MCSAALCSMHSHVIVVAREAVLSFSEQGCRKEYECGKHYVAGFLQLNIFRTPCMLSCTKIWKVATGT